MDAAMAESNPAIDPTPHPAPSAPPAGLALAAAERRPGERAVQRPDAAAAEGLAGELPAKSPAGRPDPAARDTSASHEPPGSPAGPRARRRKPLGRRRLVAVLVALAAIIGGGSYWWLNRGLVDTDDAFIDGNAVTLSPQVDGRVLRLLIDDNQRVKAGDLLLEIDPNDYEAALASARANLDRAVADAAQASANLDLTRTSTAATIASAESGVDLAKASLAQTQAELAASVAEAARAAADVERYRALSKNDYASRQTLDQAEATARSSAARQLADTQAVGVARARIGQAEAALAQAETAAQQIAVKEAELKSAEAAVEAAQAAVRTAELNLSYTRIVAPQDGYITRRQVNAGDVIEKNQTLATLVFGRPWVTANFKETQLTDMRPGQPVKIAVDAYPGVAFRGHVDSIMRGTGSHFSLLPPENATGNYVKVVQRVPVKIVFDGPEDADHVLGLGMSVVPTVDMRAGAPRGE
jgi:membrane fusion protein, multidrug efflux system